MVMGGVGSGVGGVQSRGGGCWIGAEGRAGEGRGFGEVCVRGSGVGGKGRG